MADTMKFDLVSPERRLASGEAKSVQLPGYEGQMTAMPDHAPLITTLRPGVVTAETTDGVQRFAVVGGFAEINGSATTVLAEAAYAATSDNREQIEGILEDARQKAAEADAEHRDLAELMVADITQLLDDMV
jgi:F-type H+-transporting ATPase subunit epsilon